MQQLLLKSLSVFLLVLIYQLSPGQTNNATSYLKIRFEKLNDKVHSRSYYLIKAEGGSDSTARIYSLIKYSYNFRDKTIDTPGDFYYLTKAPTDKLYNYFLSETEGLNYLLKEGWSLITAYSEAISYSDIVKNIHSQTFFWLRK